MAKPRRYPRATRKELAAAFAYAREHAKYKRFAPATDELKLDLVTLFIIDREVAKRRDEESERGNKRSNLAFLTATAIRDLFGRTKRRSKSPMSTEEAQRVRDIEALIKAYEGIQMKLFNSRGLSVEGRPAGDTEPGNPLERSKNFRLT